MEEMATKRIKQIVQIRTSDPELSFENQRQWQKGVHYRSQRGLHLKASAMDFKFFHSPKQKKGQLLLMSFNMVPMKDYLFPKCLIYNKDD